MATAIKTKNAKPKMKTKTQVSPTDEALKDIAEGLVPAESVGVLIDTGVVTLDDAISVVTKGVKRNADKAKEWDGRKAFDRDVFFELATRYAEENQTLERQSLELTGTEDEVMAKVKKRFPLFRVLEISGDGETFDVLIEEDPAKIKVSIQNLALGFEFTRGVTMRGAGFDVKRFMADHMSEDGQYEPIVDAIIEQSVSLAETMNLKGVQTKAVLGSTLADLIEEGLATITYSINDKKAETYLEEHPETLETFQSYIIEGTPSSSLLAPKKLAKKKK